MNLAQRYVFGRLLGAFLVAFPGLAVSIWASQALQHLSLVTDRGQGIGVFLEATLLLLPGLVTIIAPVTLLIAVIYGLNSLNGDSELVTLTAGGAAPRLLIKPLLALSIPVTILVAASTLYFGPASIRASNALIADVNSNVISSVIRPGQFRALQDDVTVFVGERRPDGTLGQVFVFDQRDPQMSNAYIAESGATIPSTTGSYLLMLDGEIQRQPRDTGEVTVIRFDQYSINLSTFVARAGAGALQPPERNTGYLLDPDTSDPIFQANPYRYLGEFHNRVTTPLYALTLTFLPAVILGHARTIRRGRGGQTFLAAALAGGLMALGLFVDGGLETDPAMMPVGYGIPLLGFLIPVAFLLTGRRLRRPRWLRPSTWRPSRPRAA